jgi:hypothetical protein
LLSGQRLYYWDYLIVGLFWCTEVGWDCLIVGLLLRLLDSCVILVRSSRLGGVIVGIA